MHIEIHEKDFKKALKIVLTVLLLAAVIWIGKEVTPVDTRGSMLFLSPHVAQIATYQRRVQNWAAEMDSIEIDMRNILQGDSMDLFNQDRAFQSVNRRAVNLVTAIDSTRAPGSLAGLRELMTAAADAHQKASSALGEWISQPSKATKTAAEETIAASSAVLDRIYSNPWVVIKEGTEISNDSP